MFSIIGILVVFGAVVGGYLMEKGNLMVLVQPAELVIIGGAAAGTRADRQSAAYSEEDRGRHRGRLRRIEVSPSSAIWTR